MRIFPVQRILSASPSVVRRTISTPSTPGFVRSLGEDIYRDTSKLLAIDRVRMAHFRTAMWPIHHQLGQDIQARTGKMPALFECGLFAGHGIRDKTPCVKVCFCT